MVLTAVAYVKVEGTQGRYFLIFLPFVVYGISQTSSRFGHSLVLKTLCVGVVAILILSSTGLTIYNRYFYFGRSFSNPNALGERINKKEIDIPSLTQIPVTTPLSFTSTYPIQGNKIGGFQLLAANERSVTIPYRYILKDASCTNVSGQDFLIK